MPKTVFKQFDEDWFTPKRGVFMAPETAAAQDAPETTVVADVPAAAAGEAPTTEATNDAYNQAVSDIDEFMATLDKALIADKSLVEIGTADGLDDAAVQAAKDVLRATKDRLSQIRNEQTTELQKATKRSTDQQTTVSAELTQALNDAAQAAQFKLNAAKGPAETGLKAKAEAVLGTAKTKETEIDQKLSALQIHDAFESLSEPLITQAKDLLGQIIALAKANTGNQELDPADALIKAYDTILAATPTLDSTVRTTMHATINTFISELDGPSAVKDKHTQAMGHISIKTYPSPSGPTVASSTQKPSFNGNISIPDGKTVFEDSNSTLTEALTKLGFTETSPAQNIRSLQTKYGLQVDGIAGPKTVGLINTLLEIQHLQPTPAAEQTDKLTLPNSGRFEDSNSAMQDHLKTLLGSEYQSDPVDHDKNIRTFQAKYGLKADGIVGSKTMEMINQLLFLKTLREAGSPTAAEAPAVEAATSPSLEASEDDPTAPPLAAPVAEAPEAPDARRNIENVRNAAELATYLTANFPGMVFGAITMETAYTPKPTDGVRLGKKEEAALIEFNVVIDNEAFTIREIGVGNTNQKALDDALNKVEQKVTSLHEAHLKQTFSVCNDPIKAWKEVRSDNFPQEDYDAFKQALLDNSENIHRLGSFVCDNPEKTGFKGNKNEVTIHLTIIGANGQSYPFTETVGKSGDANKALGEALRRMTRQIKKFPENPLTLNDPERATRNARLETYGDQYASNPKNSLDYNRDQKLVAKAGVQQTAVDAILANPTGPDPDTQAASKLERAKQLLLGRTKESIKTGPPASFDYYYLDTTTTPNNPTVKVCEVKIDNNQINIYPPPAGGQINLGLSVRGDRAPTDAPPTSFYIAEAPINVDNTKNHYNPVTIESGNAMWIHENQKTSGTLERPINVVVGISPDTAIKMVEAAVKGEGQPVSGYENSDNRGSTKFKYIVLS